MPVRAAEMFADATSAKEISKRHRAYVDHVNHGITDHRLDRTAALPHQSGTAIDWDLLNKADAPTSPFAMLNETLQRPDIVKAMDPAALASVAQTLDGLRSQVPDLTKDLTTTSPVATGLVIFDLETGAKMLTPKPTPLRNRIARRRGYGLAHRYKRITGFSGTGTAGVGVVRPGIQDSTQTNFAAGGSANTLQFNRGPKISYVGDEFAVNYIQFGVSDEVNWSAQFAGQGFQDIRALSRNAVTWASMLLEERVMLYGRGTGTGFHGVLAAPTGVAGVARAATGSEVGISGATTSIYVRVVAELGDYGVSQASAATAGIAVTNGQVVDITYTLPAGATGAKLFVSTGAADPGDASRFLYVFKGSATSPTPGGRSGYNKLTIQGALPTTGTIPTAYPLTQAPAGSTANLTTGDGGSGYVNEYDGILTYATDPAICGYTNAINGLFSQTQPGVEFQVAFGAMYDAVKADPDRILFAGQDRRQLSETIKGASNSNYGIRLVQDDVSGYTLGAIAVSIVNEVTGKDCSIEVHPWMPQGNALILSDQLPIPDTQVDQVFAIYNVQDLMGVDWPVLQFTYDTSSYWFGTMVCYAPAWLGSITGIQRN